MKGSQGLLLAIVFSIHSFCPLSNALPPGAGNLTWADEFDGLALDGTKWVHRASGPRHDAINTPAAVGVSNGVLTIKTYTELGTNWTGMIATLALFEQTYGYFEARMKFRTSPGQWSAFWLQSQTVGNPVGDPANAGVEMDICEHRARDGANNDIGNRIQQALIWDGYGVDSKAKVQLSGVLPGLTNDTWHTWGLSWAPDGYTFLYDDVPIWFEASPVSRRSQFIILSSEVWAFFAGTIPAEGYGTSASSTTDVQVDYVRVYDSAVIQPKFTSISKLSDDRTRVRFLFSPGRTNILQASTNLATWENLKVYPSAGVGASSFTDTNSAPQRFYRMVSP